jgi:hypothetical protein
MQRINVRVSQKLSTEGQSQVNFLEQNGPIFSYRSLPEKPQLSFRNEHTEISSSINFKTSQNEFTQSDSSYLQIRHISDQEQIDAISDNYPLLSQRKAILRIIKALSEFLSILTSSLFFQLIVFCVIVLNAIILALENPTWVTLPSPYDSFELFFVWFYTSEFLCLVGANGLFLSPASYFRNQWNYLDFAILIAAWLSIYAGSGFTISSLRALRLLRL